MAEGSRQRGGKLPRNSGGGFNISFSNPYPWMSSIEAMVHLALEEHRVPFSWRYFDGYAPDFTELLVNTGYQPEFTLSEYKVVILVTSTFFGTLPGVLDKTALATVTLEADGWQVVNLFDPEIRSQGAWSLLIKALPSLGSITGPVKINPYGRPNLINRLHNYGHGHPQPILKLPPIHKKRDTSERKRTNLRGVRRIGDYGRSRANQQRAVTRPVKAR